MFLRVAKLLALVAAVQLLGGHWLVLQTVAWTGMIVKYSQTDTVTVALEKTFSGEHPCDLCHEVQKGGRDEQQKSTAKLLVKLNAVLAPAVALPSRLAEAHRFAMVETCGRVRSLAPLVPPPLA